MAVYVVRSPAEVPGIARLGPGALDVDRETFARLMGGRSGQLKGALTDQTLVSGIGNAYSDEILHAARLSPFKMADKLTEDELVRLYDAMRATLTEALERQRGQRAATMKGEKRSGLMVHARTGCPARSAATPSARSASPTPRCSTARPVRPAASHWPTAGCPSSCAEAQSRIACGDGGLLSQHPADHLLRLVDARRRPS